MFSLFYRAPSMIATCLLTTACALDATEPNALPGFGSFEEQAENPRQPGQPQPGDPNASGQAGNNTPREGELPAVYRFTCLDIQNIGDADGSAIQARLLERTWERDLDVFRLNLLLELLALSEDESAGYLRVRSGVLQEQSTNLLAVAQADSESFPFVFAPTQRVYKKGDVCSEAVTAPATDSSTWGTVTLDLGPDDLLYIYAEEEGEPVNCTPDPSPDAIPIRAAQVTMTISDDRKTMFGSLTACLARSEAENVCACLGECNPATTPNPICAPCNPDGIPLDELLFGINPSPRCTNLLGQDAFDFDLGFIAKRVLLDEPE